MIQIEREPKNKKKKKNEILKDLRNPLIFKRKFVVDKLDREFQQNFYLRGNSSYHFMDTGDSLTGNHEVNEHLPLEYRDEYKLKNGAIYKGQ